MLRFVSKFWAVEERRPGCDFLACLVLAGMLFFGGGRFSLALSAVRGLDASFAFLRASLSLRSLVFWQRGPSASSRWRPFGPWPLRSCRRALLRHARLHP